MSKHLMLLILLFTIFCMFSTDVSSEIFSDSGLVDIPTGEVLKHGIFGVGVYAPFQDISEFQRNTVIFRVSFGMFDRVEFGATHILPHSNDASRSFLAHLKAHIVTESGLIPNVALGIENLGDKVSYKWNTYEPQSSYLVISKTFNLPRIHLISGHIGIGNNRFATDDRPVGFFAGVSTEISPAFARGDIGFNLEYDGVGVNAGVRHTANSGLQIAAGVETLNNPDEIRYLLSISWSNAKMLEQIDGVKRLARQAAKLASQASSQARRQTESSEETTE